MTKRTRKLSVSEYGSPLYLKARQVEIKSLVDRESAIEWSKRIDTVELPQIPHIPKSKDFKYSVGWVNFIKNVMRESAKELRP